MRDKPTTDDPIVQLATRVPAALLQRVRIFCVTHEKSVMQFVAEAIREKLAHTKLIPLVMSAANLLAA